MTGAVAGARWKPPSLQPAYALFSLNSFVAAMLALYIGFAMGLPRPYWAMLTVYITAQPLTGALRSKALFRVLGTVLGASAAVVLVPTFINSPFALSLAMAAWAGGCLYISLLDRTPRAYVFMLAGYTCAIIGFPSVTAPGAVFETAIARVEEITLGIGCASLVHTVFFPRDVTVALNGKIAVYMADAQRWIAGALLGRHGPSEERERRRLASDVTELQVLSTHLPFDTSNLRPRARAVRALQDRLSILLPLLSGVEDRLDGLREAGGLPPALLELAVDTAAWASDPDAPRQAALDLMARCETLTPPLGPEAPADWPTLLTLSATTRLSQLIEALQESRELSAFVADPGERSVEHLDAVVRARAVRPLHRDHGLAALSALALVMAVLACCAFWIFTAWPEGAVAAMMATVFSSFYATQDDPAPALVGFMGWTIVSMPIAALYLFAILPAIDGFPLLVTALAPAFLVMGYFQADPRQMGRAMPLILGVAGALSLQEVFTADFPAFLNSNLAQIAGIGAALSSTQLFRTISAGWSARRLLRSGWRDIAEVAAARRETSRERWTSAMLDRLGLLTPRLASAEPDEELQAANALVDLRVGLNVIDLKTVRRTLAPASGAAADAALGAIARLYALRASGRPGPSDGSVLASIDAAMREIERAPLGPARQQGLVALAGLRRTLFPAAAGFSSEAAA
ncbi:MAG: FUSC family protein [Caulobacteraceae bacterium]|nr:FUSC family protein [Caulobacteraceae bacterium]